jgi:ribosomal protein L22
MAEEEKPKRRRRRRKAEADEAAAPSPQSTPESSSEESDAADEVQATPADIEAQDAATDVMLEADDEAEDRGAGEGDSEVEDQAPPDQDTADEEAEPEADAPRRVRRRRRGAAEPKAEKPRTPAKPAPTRRRSRRDPNLPPPVVRAQAKYVRSSARKARLVCDHIRGKSVPDARAILAHTPRGVARDWSKLLESAIANAENNHELVGEDLYIKAVHADEGPTIKRFRPRAMGRATRIRKRTSHLTILLTPKD